MISGSRFTKYFSKKVGQISLENRVKTSMTIGLGFRVHGSQNIFWKRKDKKVLKKQSRKHDCWTRILGSRFTKYFSEKIGQKSFENAVKTSMTLGVGFWVHGSQNIFGKGRTKKF